MKRITRIISNKDSNDSYLDIRFMDRGDSSSIHTVYFSVMKQVGYRVSLLIACLFYVTDDSLTTKNVDTLYRSR